MTIVATEHGYVECEHIRLDRHGYTRRGMYFGVGPSVWDWQAYASNGDFLHGCVRCDRRDRAAALSEDVARALGAWRRTIWCQYASETRSEPPEAWPPHSDAWVGFVWPTAPTFPLALRDLPPTARRTLVLGVSDTHGVLQPGGLWRVTHT